MKEVTGRMALAMCLYTSAASIGADQAGDYHGTHMWEHGAWHGWFGGPILMVAIVIVVVAIAVLLVRGLRETPTHTGIPPGKSPIEMLKERYARGEIDSAEFDERRKVLEA